MNRDILGKVGSWRGQADWK